MRRAFPDKMCSTFPHICTANSVSATSFNLHKLLCDTKWCNEVRAFLRVPCDQLLLRVGVCYGTFLLSYLKAQII
jgi:hypothetical protein